MCKCCKMTTNYLGHAIFICHQKLNKEAFAYLMNERVEKKSNKRTLSPSPSFINFAGIFAKF